jgi:hypothetical protein
MRAILVLFAIIGSTMMAGCNNVAYRGNTNAYYDLTQCCCDNPCNETGYYYNGYRENGFRYCVAKRRYSN